MEFVKFLKLTFTVKCSPSVDENGRGIWKATSDSLSLVAEGETPDAAVAKLQDLIQSAESSNAREVKKVFMFKEKVVKDEKEETPVEVKKTE